MKNKRDITKILKDATVGALLGVWAAMAMTVCIFVDSAGIDPITADILELAIITIAVFAWSWVLWMLGNWTNELIKAIKRKLEARA